MKEIPLTQGKVALVDDVDFDYLNQFKWYAFKHRQTYYAARKGHNRRNHLLMHREIVCVPLGLETDHKNGDGLDNRRSNLRVCTRLENSRNQHKCLNNKSSTFKGVSWRKKEKKWAAYIKVDTKLIRLGMYDSEIDAAKEYNFAAMKHFHEFAQINVL